MNRELDRSHARHDTVALMVVENDVIVSNGLRRLLGAAAGISGAATDEPDVIVFGNWYTDGADLRRLAGLRMLSAPVVLLTRSVIESQLNTLIDHNVVGIVDRNRTTVTALAEAVRRAAVMIPRPRGELLAELTGVVRLMQRSMRASHGLGRADLTDRESEILRMLADGAETSEIALRLNFSEGTIKHVLHDLTTRFHFRNRVHAVATALRAGVLSARTRTPEEDQADRTGHLERSTKGSANHGVSDNPNPIRRR